MKGVIDLSEYEEITATVGAVGRITIPQGVRDKLDLKPGVHVAGFIKRVSK